ncbi:MAG: hypothetical protein V1706_01250 [Pseudomonadota bacterium]
MKESTLTKKISRTKSGENLQAQTGLDTFATGTISIMGGISALIGIWAAACFIGGLLSSGPVELAYGWFRAITGL